MATSASVDFSHAVNPATARAMPVALRAFYAAAAREFEFAAQHEDVVECHLRFGDRRVRLRFAGPELARVLLGALAHRRDPEVGAVHAAISLWEEVSCPAGFAPRPWREVDIGPGGLVRGSDPGHVLAVHETYSGAVTLVDGGERALLHRVPHRDGVPWWDRAAPLRPALFWALGGEGRHLVHAAAVGDDRGGILLVGAPGSGKTTVARIALINGYGYVADDYVLLTRVGAEARAVSLYSTMSVRAEPEANEKVVVDLATLMPGSLRESLPVRAVVVPRISGGRTRLSRLRPAEALLAWAPCTALQMPFDGAVLATLAAVVRQVPCFELQVGADEAELAGAVERILSGIL